MGVFPSLCVRRIKNHSFKNDMKAKTILLPILALLLGGACTEKTSQKLEGQYAGEMSFEKGMGGYLTLSLQEKNRCALTTLFYDSDGTSSTQWGKWETEGNTLTLTFDTCQLVATQLNKEQISLPAYGGKATLEKETPLTVNDFTGKYHLSGAGDEGWNQYLEISLGKEGKPLVSFASSDVKGGKLMTASGDLVNNQIEIHLNKLKTELEATLVIRFEGAGELDVSASDFEQRYDLQYFCNGGGTLAGLYVKDGIK